MKEINRVRVPDATGRVLGRGPTGEGRCKLRPADPARGKWRLLEQKSSKCSRQNTLSQSGTKITKKPSPEAPTSSCNIRHINLTKSKILGLTKWQNHHLPNFRCTCIHFYTSDFCLKDHLHARKMKHAEANEDKPKEALLLPI